MFLMVDRRKRNNAFGTTATSTNGLALLLQLAHHDYRIWSGTNVTEKSPKHFDHVVRHHSEEAQALANLSQSSRLHITK